MEEKRNAYRILVGKPEGKRPFVDAWCALHTVPTSSDGFPQI
jgi:hypothetical protein